MKLLLPLVFLGAIFYGNCAATSGKDLNTKTRKADYPINDIFINRWSARAMSGEAVSDAQLFALFEAARWAPSSYNNQPWRFMYAKKDTQHWNTFFNALVPFNQTWCKNASALVVIASKKTFDSGRPSASHSFDAGSAWQNFALQGSSMGLVVHAMGGFDYEKIKTELNIPDDYAIEAMVAVGCPGNITKLPEEMRNNEKPSQRKPISQLVFEGRFVQS